MTSPEAAPRSLTQMLREFDDATLRALLMARPDLADPEPTTFSQVASRATTRDSVKLALDSLNALELWVAGVAAPATGAISPHDLPGIEPDTARDILERLRRLGLLWGGPGSVRAVRALVGELPDSSREAPPPGPPAPAEAAHQDPDRVDDVAAGSAFELVRRMEVLVEHLDRAPLQLRQDGGFQQREARAVASLLDLPVAIATLHVEIAQAAGLIGLLPMARADSLLPTVACDTWYGQPLSDQWVMLALGWRDGHPPSGSATMKSCAFQVFGPPGTGKVVAQEDVQRSLAWQRPRLADDWSRRATTMLSQSGWIGITGLGALASFGLIDDLAALSRRLPKREDTVLLQNDLTAVAPAPLTPYAARELSALADVESRGGATVYRFTLESLRRAHSAGWTSEQIRSVLEQRSRTPIPQPLSYLIADLDRTRAAARMLSQQRPPRPPVARHATLRANTTPLTAPGSHPEVDAETAARIVHVLRRAASFDDREPSTAAAPSAEGMADAPLETLREAVETGELVWVGYVDASGAAAERLLYATGVEEGRLLARTSRGDEQLSLPVHRINAAHIIRGGSV